MMRRYLNATRRLQNIRDSLGKHMYEQCWFLCNGIPSEYPQPYISRSSFINCHNIQMINDGLLNRKSGANVYHN